MKLGQFEFGAISNVRKSGDEEGVYFVALDISVAEGFPFEQHIFCARADDYATTGKWVYQQILDGNFEGEITQLLPNTDPSTGEPYPQDLAAQPDVGGAETL